MAASSGRRDRHAASSRVRALVQWRMRSVPSAIARIEDRLPDMAKDAGVDVIVSKWTLTYRSPAAKFVDVTGLIVYFSVANLLLAGSLL